MGRSWVLRNAAHDLPSVGRRDRTFEGPVAMQANGGEPVPFRWTRHVHDEERELTPGVHAAPGEPGGPGSSAPIRRRKPQ